MGSFGFRRWTRHSLVLIVAGALYIGIGFAFFTAPALAAKDPSLKIALQWLTLTDWGYIFIACGSLSIISSVWPQCSEKWGYIILTALSSAWAAFYLLAVILAYSPPITLLRGLTWSLLAFVWWAISGLVSPSQVVTRDHRPAQHR